MWYIVENGKEGEERGGRGIELMKYLSTQPVPSILSRNFLQFSVLNGIRLRAPSKFTFRSCPSPTIYITNPLLASAHQGKVVVALVSDFGAKSCSTIEHVDGAI